MQFNFNAASVPPAEAAEAIPAGFYNVVIIEDEYVETSDKNGQMLKLTLQIIDGEYKGRKLYDRLNLVNRNPTAVEIAFRTLSAICHAVGVMQITDTTQLRNRPMQVKVSLRPAGTGADNRYYEASNEVKGYKALNGAVAQGATPAGFGQAPAQPAFPAQHQQAFTQQPMEQAQVQPQFQPPVQQAPAQQFQQAPAPAQQFQPPVQQPTFQPPQFQPPVQAPQQAPAVQAGAGTGAPVPPWAQQQPQ